ncbi:MAG TPA: hypothetical protein DF383_12425 [Deltaproteobacteria bacterium]|nr:hypothetical protein [Deltaproteobacteria bacterium]
MKNKILTIAIVAGLFSGAVGMAQAACPEGNYAAKGWNPGVPTTGKESYTGTVVIKSVGSLCQVDWKIGTQTFGGLGTYEPASKMLYVSYASLGAGWFGIVFYKDAGATLNGQWAVYNDKSGKLGAEILTKQ